MEIERQRWQPVAKNFVPEVGGFGWSTPFSVGSTYDWEDDMEKEEGLFLLDLEFSDAARIAGAWIKKSATEYAAYLDAWKTYRAPLGEHTLDNAFGIGKPGRILDLDIYYEQGQKKLAYVFVANFGAAQRGWWWSGPHGYTGDELKLILDGQAVGAFTDHYKKRIVSLARGADGKFVFVLQPQTAQDGWVWGYGASQAFVTKVINAQADPNKWGTDPKRLVYLKRHGTGDNFTFIALNNPGKKIGWQWWPSITFPEVVSQAKKNNERVLSLEQDGSSADRFSAILIQNT